MGRPGKLCLNSQQGRGAGPSVPETLDTSLEGSGAWGWQQTALIFSWRAASCTRNHHFTWKYPHHLPTIPCTDPWVPPGSHWLTVWPNQKYSPLPPAPTLSPAGATELPPGRPLCLRRAWSPAGTASGPGCSAPGRWPECGEPPGPARTSEGGRVPEAQPRCALVF